MIKYSIAIFCGVQLVSKILNSCLKKYKSTLIIVLGGSGVVAEMIVVDVFSIYSGRCYS